MLVLSSRGGWEDHRIMPAASPGRMSGTVTVVMMEHIQEEQWGPLATSPLYPLQLPLIGAFFLDSDWSLCEINRSPSAWVSWSLCFCQFHFLDWILPQSFSSAAMGWILPSEDKSLKFNSIIHLLGFPKITPHTFVKLSQRRAHVWLLALVLPQLWYLLAGSPL